MGWPTTSTGKNRSRAIRRTTSQLLVVLAPEHRRAGTDEREELRDDGRDALEVSRSKCAVERLRERADAHPRLIPGRIHLLGGRREDGIGAGARQLGDVALEVARILREVLRGPELRGVDEDRDDDERRSPARLFHEREVTAMQRAHRRHEADAAASRARLVGDPAQLRARTNNGGSHGAPRYRAMPQKPRDSRRSLLLHVALGSGVMISAHSVWFGPRASALALATAAVFVALVEPAARADSPTDAPSKAQLATARELFTQAVSDEDAGRWQDALDKLRQVALVKATAGVRYHIALSEEHMDRLANALEDFEGAEEQARAEHAQDVLRLVGGELEGLRPRVPRLAIHVNPEGVAQEVRLDGQAIDVAQMGESRAVNPGTHAIEVRADGWQTATAHVTLSERDATSLDIPLATARPAPSPVASSLERPSEAPRPAAPFVWTSARVGAVAATAGAAALLGAGIGAYFAAASAHDDGVQSCAAIANPAANACDSQKNTVRAWDWVAAGTWAGAAVSAGLAVFLWTRPAGAHPSTASVSWLVGPGSVALRGSF